MLHVDDFFWGGNAEFKNAVINPLCNKFKTKSILSNSFTYVGLNITKSNGKIFIDQIGYINAIDTVDISRERQRGKDDLCTSDETSKYCKMIGKLNWAGNQTRPDILFRVCQLCAKMKAPTVRDVINANKVVVTIKANPLKLCFPSLGNLLNVKFCVMPMLYLAT